MTRILLSDPHSAKGPETHEFTDLVAVNVTGSSVVGHRMREEPAVIAVYRNPSNGVASFFAVIDDLTWGFADLVIMSD